MSVPTQGSEVRIRGCVDPQWFLARLSGAAKESDLVRMTDFEEAKADVTQILIFLCLSVQDPSRERREK